MRWDHSHRDAMAAAFEAHEDLDVDTLGRIDVFGAIAGDGIKLAFQPLDCAALYLPASIAVKSGILVNSQHPLALQRLSAAHELGHHTFGHGEQVDREGEPRGTGARLPPHEMLAEAFAGWFLMPPEAIVTAQHLLGLTEPASAADAYALALRLGTSFAATCNRIEALRQWRTTPLKSLKQELTSDAPLGGWRNDVWLLSERDSEATIVVRCGDALLLDLAGWDIDELPDGATATHVPGADLLTPSRWRVDLPVQLPAGPASLVLRQAASRLVFELMLERPRFGRFVAVRSRA